MGKRVLQVIYQDPARYPPTLNTGRVLANAGHEVLCLGLRRGLGVRLTSTPRLHLAYLDAFRKSPRSRFAGVWEPALLRIATNLVARAWRPDLIVAYDHLGLWATIGTLSGFPVVFHILDLVPDSLLAASWRLHSAVAAAQRAVPACRLLVFPDRHRAAYFYDRFGCNVPSVVVANAPLRAIPQRNDKLKDILAARSGERPEFLAVCVGKMGMYRETIEAVANSPRWHVAFIGMDTPESEAHLREFAAHRGAGTRTHFLPYTPYDVVREWLQGADAGLAFYPRESTLINWRLPGTASVKLLEYLAAGIPGIVCPTPDYVALAKETHGAITTLSDETPAAIESTLAAFAENREDYLARVAAARAAHSERFNLEHQLSPVLALLE